MPRSAIHDSIFGSRNMTIRRRQHACLKTLTGRLLSQDRQSILCLQEDLHSDPCPCVVCVVWSCTEPRRASNPRLPPVSATDKQASTACAMDDGPRKTSNLATNRNVQETTIKPPVCDTTIKAAHMVDIQASRRLLVHYSTEFWNIEKQYG